MPPLAEDAAVEGGLAQPALILYAILYAEFRSARTAALVMANLTLALIGGVVASRSPDVSCGEGASFGEVIGILLCRSNMVVLPTLY